MSTITPDQEAAIRERLASHHVAEGLGDHDDACSIASINLALSGTLTDEIPECMSPVIGRLIHLDEVDAS